MNILSISPHSLGLVEETHPRVEFHSWCLSLILTVHPPLKTQRVSRCNTISLQNNVEYIFQNENWCHNWLKKTIKTKTEGSTTRSKNLKVCYLIYSVPQTEGKDTNIRLDLGRNNGKNRTIENQWNQELVHWRKKINSVVYKLDCTVSTFDNGKCHIQKSNVFCSFSALPIFKFSFFILFSI